jgi:hypothetical protein
MSTKIKVILIPDVHTGATQITKMLITGMKKYINQVPNPNKTILNVSEGNVVSSFYTEIYEGTHFKSMIEFSDRVKERYPVLIPCVKFMIIILVIIETLFDSLRRMTPSQIESSVGVRNVRYDENYIDVLINYYKLNEFININEDVDKSPTESFYKKMQFIYYYLIYPTLKKPKYELPKEFDYNAHLNAFITLAQRGFSAINCNGITVDPANPVAAPIPESFTDILEGLKAFNTVEERKVYINQQKRVINNIRDTILVNRIENEIDRCMQTSTDLNLIIIEMGMNHYDNIREIITANPKMEFHRIQTHFDAYVRASRPTLNLADASLALTNIIIGGRQDKVNKNTKKILNGSGNDDSIVEITNTDSSEYQTNDLYQSDQEYTTYQTDDNERDGEDELEEDLYENIIIKKINKLFN